MGSYEDDRKRNGSLMITISEKVEAEGVAEIVTALAKISEFFGARLMGGNSGGGIPDTTLSSNTPYVDIAKDSGKMQ